MAATIKLDHEINFARFIEEFADSGLTVQGFSNTESRIVETGNAPNNIIKAFGANHQGGNLSTQTVTSMVMYIGYVEGPIEITNVNLTMQSIVDALQTGIQGFLALLGTLTLTGSTGDDVFSFGGSNDTGSGGDGNDTFHGGGGQDTLNGEGGNDYIDGGTGVDTMNGGTGFDTLSYLSANVGVILNVPRPAQGGGAAAGESYAQFEAYYLTNLVNAVDDFTGGAAGEYVYGFAGKDFIRSGGGSDFIDGGAGADYIDAGDGFDYVSWNTSLGVVVNLLNPSANTGDAAGDTVLNAEAFYLSEYNDFFVGQNGANIVFGMGGSDSLFGGSSSNDWLFGGDGNDFISGGTLNDLLSGGAGADIYAFTNYGTNGIDQVLDFTTSVDRIQLSGAGFGLSAGARFTAGFNFIASNAPAAVVAGGTLLYNTANGFLYYDIDGTGGQAAIALAQFANAPNIQASDFFVI